MRNTAIAQIDLAALRDNLSQIRALCPHSRIMAMVKADAYGHGLIPVARTLSDTDGLAVARLEEALVLREAGITQRILLLATLLDAADIAVCAERHIDVTAHDEASVVRILKQASATPMRVWLKLDSGMHRVGLLPDEFVEADRLLAKQPGIRELIHMTHFSSASTPPASVMEQQLSCFLRCRRTDSKAKVSLANSAALFARNDTHADWARPGIALYGVNPLGADNHVSLRAVMSFRTYVIAARKIGVGEAVGYNERWRSVRPSRIGTLGVGYGDGYPRHARVGTPIWIKGHRVPLVGQVSMDSMMVDLTDRDDVEIGDEAVLWGPELPAAAVAECADTISYELFTSLQRRVTRVYSEVPTGHRVPN